MIIYIDLLFILNFIVDYLLLLTNGIVLKRKINKFRLVISSLVGELSILLLIINSNYLLLIIIKLLLAVIMNVIAFSYNNLKYTIINLIYFYMLSIILGGFLYYLKINNINYYISLLLIPIILFMYYYQSKKNNNYAKYYQVIIYFNNNKSITCTGYLDTGNKLFDPISNKPVILLDRRLTKGVIQIRTPIYVPFNVLNNHGLLKCFKPKYIIINNNKIDNVLIGIMDNNINIDGVDCILNERIL